MDFLVEKRAGRISVPPLLNHKPHRSPGEMLVDVAPCAKAQDADLGPGPLIDTPIFPPFGRNRFLRQLESPKVRCIAYLVRVVGSREGELGPCPPLLQDVEECLQYLFWDPTCRGISLTLVLNMDHGLLETMTATELLCRDPRPFQFLGGPTHEFLRCEVVHELL